MLFIFNKLELFIVFWFTFFLLGFVLEVSHSVEPVNNHNDALPTSGHVSLVYDGCRVSRNCHKDG
uniref:Uncharacterized protein n=1 Tax=Strigamia maritima TaxID=126957 RepID=T1ITG6_STRMM